MIQSVHFTHPAPSQAIRITMQDGAEWGTDASLPPDTEIRRMLADWLAAGNTIAPYVAPPAPVPASITRRQCARELLNRAMITSAEALAMTRTGEPPEMIDNLFDAMPAEAATLGRIDFAADTYMRDNPLLVAVMTANGATPEQIDDFFRAAAAL